MIERRTFLKGIGGIGAGLLSARALLGATPASASGTTIVAGAGDIAGANGPNQNQIATQQQIQAIAPAAVLVMGDAQYDDGTLAQYQASYDPTWGQFKNITNPAPGDHDYNTPNAQGFKDYWGISQTYYSWDLGGWHFIALDSRIDHSATSLQCAWLTADFAATTSPTIAYFAHPRFSSGTKHGSDPGVSPFWDILYDNGSQKCKLILNGHEHLYERFGRLLPAGNLNQFKGIREITVGTGGAALYDFGTAITGSQYRNNTTRGVIKLTLTSTSLRWDFIDVNGVSLDHGTDSF